MSVELVAMAPWGDGVIVRRKSGELYFWFPEGISGSRPISGTDVTEAIGMHGYLSVDEEFADMAALARRVQEIVAEQPTRAMPRPELTVDDVRRFMPRLAELAIDPSSSCEAIRRANKYLGMEGVPADRRVYAQIRGVITQSTAALSTAEGSELTPETPSQKRWKDLSGAA